MKNQKKWIVSVINQDRTFEIITPIDKKETHFKTKENALLFKDLAIESNLFLSVEVSELKD